MDHRIAAEILLLFYDDMVDEGAAPPLPQIPKSAYHPLVDRLRPELHALDAALTAFGLSPHPSLVLVLEGDTEMVLIPQAMRLRGVLEGRSFIELIKGGGADKDLGLLVYAVATPQVGAELDADHVLLERPVTHFLVASDEEGHYTPGKREARRQHYVRQIASALRDRHGIDLEDADIDALVRVHTWGPLPFEFACFTDDDLARAITQVRGPGGQPVTTAQMTAARRSTAPGRELKNILRGPPLVKKPVLADALWPALESRLRADMNAGTPTAHPVGELVDLAVRTAMSVLREGVAMRRRP